MKIRRNPNTGELLADSESTLYSFNGSPLSRPEAASDWVIVAEVPYLFAWQSDPGQYHPAYLVANMVQDQGNDVHIFTFGGSFLYAHAWAAEYGARVSTLVAHMYDDRNLARQLAEAAGGVAW